MVSLGLILLVLAGIIALGQIRYTLDPSEDPKEIYIDVVFRGASPLEIEERMISRIEENIRGISGVDRFTSVSRENSGRITVELFETADINEVLVDVENAVNRIPDLPAGADPPLIHKKEMRNPTISLALTGDLILQEKKDYARRVRDEFMIRGGLSTVNIYGYASEEIIIELSEAQMDRFGVGFAEVAEAVQKNNLDMTGGELRMDDVNRQIRALGQKTTARELEQITVRSGMMGEQVLIGDIASVREAFEERPAERYLDGKQAVIIEVLTTNDENLVDVADYVKDFTTRFNDSNPDLHLQVVEDYSVFINERVASLLKNGIMGLVLVLLILTLFLDKRIAFLVSLIIPFALLGTFALAMAIGYDLTINVVSIFGFILVLGMLVDTGVVVSENVYRHYADYGKHPLAASRDGAAEVSKPILIALMSIAVAFSLFFFLPGKPGAFFSEVSFIVIGALFSAVLITFLFLPARLTRSKVLSGENRQTRFERLFTQSLVTFRDRWFMPYFTLVSFRWKWVNVAVFVLLLAGSAAVIRTGVLPATFFPYLDDDVQIIEIELEPGTPTDTTMSRLVRLEEAVYKVNQQLSGQRSDGRQVVTHVERFVGPATHQGRLKVVMLSGEIRGIPANEINSMFRDEADDFPDARYMRFLGASAEHRFGGLPVEVSLSANDMEELQAAARDLRAAMEQHPDLVDVADSDQPGNPEVIIELSSAGEQLGLKLSDIMGQVRIAFFGMELQNLQRDGDDVRIWLRMEEEHRRAFRDLEQFQIRTPSGLYPLHEVAHIYPAASLLEIQRIDGRRTIRVDADLADPSLSAPSILNDIEANIMPVIVRDYPGVDYSFEGQNRESMQVMGAMAAVAPILLLLMFTLVMINFQSYTQTLLVFLALPFSFVGVVIGHMIHGVTLNVFSLIGFIALIGILINNLLVLVTAFNDNLRDGQPFEQALKEAVRSRFRPILLTILSTVGGLAPLIFLGGLAAAFLQPPSIAIAYGLVFGLLISLTLAPAFLVIWNSWMLKWTRKFSDPDASGSSVEPAVKLMEHQKKSAI